MFINKLLWGFDGKICHLYENVQNRPQNKKKFYVVRKLASKTLFSSKIQNSRHEITKVIISSSIIEIETRLFFQAIRFRYQRKAMKQTLHLFDIIIMQD